MLTVFTRLFFTKPKETYRERELSLQVDRLEFELAKTRREKQAIHIRLIRERNEYNKFRLKDYPLGKHSTDVSIETLFQGGYSNPVERVLADVSRQGYDISAAWEQYGTMLSIITKYQQSMSQLQNIIGGLCLKSKSIS